MLFDPATVRSIRAMLPPSRRQKVDATPNSADDGEHSEYVNGQFHAMDGVAGCGGQQDGQ
jgi:hypothetical protein